LLKSVDSAGYFREQVAFGKLAEIIIYKKHINLSGY
jgi:hypothetical protein